MAFSAAMSAPKPSPPSLTGAQRRALRGLGHALKPVVQIGVAGLTDGVVGATADALERHELIKISIGGESPADRKQAPVDLAARTGAHVAGIVGRTALLYRRRAGDPTIELPGPIEEAIEP